MKGIISFIIGIIGLVLCIFLITSETKSTVFKIALGFVIGGLIEFSVFIIENKKDGAF